MEYIKAALIGLIQGLTEFLPVSSSGHLVLAQQALGIEMPGITFEVFLHLGTLLSVFWVFRERIINILKSFLALFRKSEWARFSSSGDRRFGICLIIASIPTAIIAFLLSDWMEKAFDTPLFVGIALAVTGGMLWLADSLPGGNKDIAKTSHLDAVIIGVFQGIAIFPGISRSGATISGALFRKLDKRTAAEFSFLLSIPAILGGALVEVVKVFREGADAAFNWLFYAVGVSVAAIAGIVAIRFFIRLLVRDRLRIFAVYCWIISIIVLCITL